MKQRDRIDYGQEQLSAVKYFKYLGITLEISGKIVNMYILRESDARNTRYGKYSEQPVTATNLDLQIVPILRYGVGILGEHRKV